MNAAEILTAVREAGAALRVEGGSLVASNASRLPPEIKTAIRENKPQIITALSVAPRFGRSLSASGSPKCPGRVSPRIGGNRRSRTPRHFLAEWGEQAEALGWDSRDLFGLHTPPANPHPCYSRLCRYDETGLVWLLEGRPVVALTETTAAIESPKTGNITVYRKEHKPAYGPVGDSLDDFT